MQISTVFLQARVYKINTDNMASTSTPSSFSPRSHGRRMAKRTYRIDELDYIGYTGSYINRREVTLYLRIPPGKYLIIPSTYEVFDHQFGKLHFETFSLSLVHISVSQTEMVIFSYECSSRPIIP